MTVEDDIRTADAAPKPKRRPPWLPAAAFFVVVLAALFWEFFFLGHGLLPVDGALTSYPWKLPQRQNYLLADQAKTFVPARGFLHEQVRQGRFPLWNPYISCGVPFVAAIQHAVFFPLNLATVFVPPFVATGLVAVAKLMLAGLFMRLYLRRLGIGELPAVFGSVAFALCGFMVTWLGHPHTNSAVFLPLVAYCLHADAGLGASWTRQRLGNAALLGLALACVVLGGHPPTAVHILMFAAAYATFLSLGPTDGAAAQSEDGIPAVEPTRRPSAHAIRRLKHLLCRAWAAPVAALAAASVMALLLSAVQWLPFLEYYRESSVAVASDKLVRASLHLSPGAAVHLFAPDAAGGPVKGHEELARLFRLKATDYHLDRTAQVGMAAWGLALVALLALRRRERVVSFHCLVAVLCLAVVYGLPPFPQLLPRIPLLRHINFQRLLLFVDFSLAVLAALGLETLTRAPGATSPRKAVGVLWGMLGGLVLVLLATNRMAPSVLTELPAADRSFFWRQLVVWLGFAGSASALIALGPRRVGRRLPLILLALETAELVHWARGYNPSIPPELYWPTTPGIEALQAEAGHERILPLGYVMLPNTAMPYRLHDARGVDYMSVRRYEQLITGREGHFWFYALAGRIPPCVTLLNARYFITEPGVVPEPRECFETVYRGPGEMDIHRFRPCRPRAMLVADSEVAPPHAVLAQVRNPDFDPATKVMLEQAPPARSGRVTGGLENAVSRVEITRYLPDRVELACEAAAPCFLLLLDTWFPGWVARVDGERVPILRADYTFRAVQVPPGTSEVLFSYEPASVRCGAAMTAAGLLIGMGLLLANRGSRRTSGSGHARTSGRQAAQAKGQT